MRKSEQIAVRLPPEQLAELDELVESGGFGSRAAALRAGIELLTSKVREQRIAEDYRRAYGASPGEDWVGEAAAAAAGEVISTEHGEG